MTTPLWSSQRKPAALACGPHKSAKEHRKFLAEEFVAMTHKGHWTLLPAKLLMDKPELRLSPLGVAPQRERRPQTMSDCSCFQVNGNTIELAPSMPCSLGGPCRGCCNKCRTRIHAACPCSCPKLTFQMVSTAQGCVQRKWHNWASCLPRIPESPHSLACHWCHQWDGRSHRRLSA